MNPKSEPKVRDPGNAPGDFYVESDCCSLCGVPWHIAPELFGYDTKGCWVKRQPSGAVEERKMFEVIATQELSCVRYGGSNSKVLEELANLGAGVQCDSPSTVTFWARLHGWLRRRQS
jgi:hypothetical protein